MDWIKGQDYPEWMEEEGLKTLKRQHLLEGETPSQMYDRITETLEKRYLTMLLNKGKSVKEANKLARYAKDKWKDYIWKGWLCPSTPILANCGTKRGYTISCFIERLEDTLDSIYQKTHEMAMLSKMGGGVGVTFDKVRGRGEAISSGGFSEGTIPFMKVYDSAIMAASQSNIRRGAASINLPIRHKDIKEFLHIREPKGDINKQCLNLNHCVTIDDYFMEKLEQGDQSYRDLYAELLSVRLNTGQPYIMYYHNVHNSRPTDMVKRNLKIDGTNICCLAGNTEVITKEGIFEIKDLVGKTVTIFDGTSWVKCNNFKEYEEDDLIRIHLKNGSFIDSNSRHRWFVAKSYNDIRNNKYTETITSELKEGMWLESDFKEYHGSEKLNAAYLKGFLLGDGTHVSDRPLLNVHFPKYNCINSLLESSLELAQEEKVHTNTVTTVSFAEEKVNENTWGRQEFKRIRGLTQFKNELISFTHEYKQNLPDFRNLNKRDKLLFLSGLLDADGTYSTSGIQISSVHEQFIIQLQKLIFSLGYSCGIDKNIKRREFKTLYRLTIGNYDSYEIFEQLSCARLEAPEIKPNRRTTGYRQIVKIEKLPNKEKVYCPQIPTTKKFLLANGILTGNTEILIPHDAKHTVVCCISSVNTALFNKWKDDEEFLEYCYLFLDVNLEEFIQNAKGKKGFENAVRFSEKSRAIGLGVLGFHTLLQRNMIPFVSLQARSLITKIGKKLSEDGEKYNKKYGKLLGNPEWCDENRNLTLQAIAPTTTNSLISGAVSQGIEPIVCNAYVQKSAKGSFIRRNKTFENLIKEKYPEKDTPEIWKEIEQTYKGSVQHLDFLSEEEKEVFLTAYEINQLELIRNASIWTKYIDQGISLNLFFPEDVAPKWYAKCHIEAWKMGIKTLYYVRTESVLGKNMKAETFADCVMCAD